MRAPTFSLALGIALALLASPAAAQRSATASAPLLATPGGRAVATVHPGARLEVGATRGDYAQVTIEGFVSADFLAGARESFPVSVRSSASGVRMRSDASTDAKIVAELRGGMGLSRVARRGDWVQVRRTGWMRRSALGTPARRVAASTPVRETPAAAAGAVDDTVPAAPQPSAEPTPPLSGDALAPSRSASLRTGPDGRILGSLGKDAVLTPIARDRGWIRVRVEGWVRESEVVPADSTLRASLSAADLRADPDGTRGKVVRWDVELLAFQVADPLRKGLVPDEPYLLARGPGDENALLYLALPPSLVEFARSLPALAPITITARVRSGRSEPVGVPILDIQTLVRR